MRKINYRLIMSDFDNTLTDRNNEVPVAVQNTINEYVENGGIFAVCTGRMLRSILPRVRQLGLKGLVVAYQGTVIADIETGKIIKSGGLDCEDAVLACREMEAHGNHVNVYAGGEIFTDMAKDDIFLNTYERITGVEAVSITDMKISDFVREKKLFCQKVTSLVAPEERDNLYEYLVEKISDKADVTCSANVLVEVSPLGDNKGKALEYIADYFKIPLDKTVAIGDNLNDISMIKAAAVGVAVGNASLELKRVADDVTISSDECGVAKTIEKYGYE